MIRVSHIIIVILLAASCVLPRSVEAGEILDNIKSDYKNFYSVPTGLKFGGGLVVGGIMANSGIDEDFQEWYQDDFRSSGTDDLADFAKIFGEGRITVPIFAVAALVGNFSEDSVVCEVTGDWGEQSLRSLLVGVPPLLVFQKVLGASRPSEEDGSEWDFWDDNNAVSGHSFMGAVPFLTAAQMTDNLGVKSAFWAGSLLCGFSRVNDDDHYLSQALMGWGLAWLSTSSVIKTEIKKDGLTAGPVIYKGNPAAAISLTF